jgi:protease-4
VASLVRGDWHAGGVNPHADRELVDGQARLMSEMAAYRGRMTSLPLRRRPVLLELDLTEVPVEPTQDDPVARLRTRGRPQLRAILRTLHEAGEDRNVVGLVTKVGGALPWATMQELRQGVLAFASHGKPTVAWAEAFGEVSDMAAYVLATAFGEVWLQPGGNIGVLGVGVETTFLRGALDRLGIEPQLEQRHEYKNAADRLMRTEFTPAHRESLTRLAESIFTEAVQDIASGRSMESDHVRRLIDTGPRTASEARDAGLIDQLGYRDQVYEAMRSRVAENAELLFADRWRRPRRPSVPARRKGHVALVEVHGGIATGRTRRGAFERQAGSDSITAQLRAAISNELARAVVLRINSPGGSAVASETIWREVCRVGEAGKPVIVSMGEVAASGGYYIACPADVIVALPATVTGSIGVIGGKFVANNLLERVGLTTGVVEQGARSRMYSPRRGFTEDERERLDATIDAVYADFVAKVAEGRRRTVPEIEDVARGRVWTGRDALGTGLVDELGGLRRAIEIARLRAGLPDDAPVLHPIHVPPVARLRRPRNSEDPRAATLTSTLWPRLSDLTAALDLPGEAVLRMPEIRIR